MVKVIGFILVALNVAMIGTFFFIKAPLTFSGITDGQQLSSYLLWDGTMLCITMLLIIGAGHSVGRGPLNFFTLGSFGLFLLVTGTSLYMVLVADINVTMWFTIPHILISGLTTLNILGLSHYFYPGRQKLV